jgi:hypothetical protein
VFFGKKLKELRLEHGKMGLHFFAEEIQMDVLLYSNIERGLVPPPPCKKWIYEMIGFLNLEQDSKEALELYKLWAEPFVMQKMHTNVVCSPFTHKTDGTPLTAEEYLGLNKHINDIGEKHNKNADRYNEEHFGKKRKDI